MSLEWSTLNECFSSPLQNSPVLNNKKQEWSDFDKNTNYNNTMSLPYDNNEQPNVALAEDAFRQVVNHESQYLYQQQQNTNALPTPALQSMQPMPQEQSLQYNQTYMQEQPMQHIHQEQPMHQEQSFQYEPHVLPDIGNPINTPSQVMNIKSDDIRNQLKNINISSNTRPTFQPQQPTFQPRRQVVNNSYGIRQNTVDVAKNINIRGNLYGQPISNKDEENRWLTILIVFIASFLLLSCK